MRNDPLDIVSKAAAALAEADGVRSGASAIVEQLVPALDAAAAFVILRGGDIGVADLVAAEGLGAVDFRRLETRIAQSSLWRILRLATPFVIDDLAQDPVLKFLAFGTPARVLIAVPISQSGACIGMLAVGFASGANIREDAIISLLRVIATLLAQAFRVERLIRADDRKLSDEIAQLKQQLRGRYDFDNLIGNSGPMRQVSRQVTQIARSNATVLLRGETGTGKELIAGAIHYNSLRSKRPFVKINCPAIPQNLIEAELFGNAGGPKAHLDAARGGTLFIEEIADLPVMVQQRLAAVIVGDSGGNWTELNVRLIASSSHDLESQVTANAFSGDLFDAIKGFTIFLPPLRDRKSDILMLADHFLEKYSAEAKKSILRISTPTIDMLAAYHFPGNVRELENAIEHAVAVCDSNVIHGRHLPPTLQTAEVSGTETRVTLASAVEAFERDLIQDALKSARGNIAKTARMLDTTERIVAYKIKRYGIDTIRFRRWRVKSF